MLLAIWLYAQEKLGTNNSGLNKIRIPVIPDDLEFKLTQL